MKINKEILRSKGMLRLAGIFVLTGLVLTVLGTLLLRPLPVAAGTDGGKQTVTAREAVRKITVNLTSQDVLVEQAAVEQVQVVYPADRDGMTYTVSEKDGELKISSSHGAGFGGFFVPILYKGWQTEEYLREQIRILVPEGTSPRFSIDTISGDAALSGLCVEGLSFESTAGNLTASEIQLTGDLSAGTTSGEMRLTNLTIDGNLVCASSSGDVDLKHVSCGGKLTANSTSGNLKMEEVTVGETLTHSCTSGDTVGQTVSADTLRCDATSGNLKIENLSVSSGIEISGTSMDVRLKMTDAMSRYQIHVFTTSGNTNLPSHYDQGGEKELRIQTTSGDVWVEFGEAAR